MRRTTRRQWDLEQLEDRCVPTTFTWNLSQFQTGSIAWRNPANWIDTTTGIKATRTPGSQVGDTGKEKVSLRQDKPGKGG